MYLSIYLSIYIYICIFIYIHIYLRRARRVQAVWPCLFKIVDEGCIFNKKDPYILGVNPEPCSSP